MTYGQLIYCVHWLNGMRIRPILKLISLQYPKKTLSYFFLHVGYFKHQQVIV
jgi:hypothetical protein